MLNKIVFSALGVVALPEVSSADLINDAHMQFTARNFYINADNRDGSVKPSKQEEWGQGFILAVQSGFTEGSVGVGVDLFGLSGFKLDSGKGTAYNSGAARGGQVFPSGSDNRAVDAFGSLGVTAKVRFSGTQVNVGTLHPQMPLLVYNNGRLLPQTFHGIAVKSEINDKFRIEGGRLEHMRDRNSSNNERMTIPGSTATTAGRSDAFYYVGGSYALTKDLELQYYGGQLEDFYQQHFLGAVHKHALPVGTLKTDVRYFVSTSDGKNASASGRAEGFRSVAGTGQNGEVGNRAWSALFTYEYGAHQVGAGYQVLTGKSGFPQISNGAGATSYLIANRLVPGFDRPGEKTWLGQYSVDFAALGMPGLTANIAYLHGWNINLPGASREWEREVGLAYKFGTGMFKGAGIALRNASLRSEGAFQRNQDQTRIIVSYTRNLF